MTEPDDVVGPASAPGVPALLGIDLGTSSAKAVMLTARGRIMSEVAVDYPVIAARPGWAESHPGDWWAAVVSAVRQAVAVAAADPVAIGLSGQMHGVVLTAASGEPLRPALLWADTRAVGELARYRALPEPARRRLGNPLSPGMAGPMLLWAAAHEPEAYRQARWALQPKDWVRLRLTGEVFAEPSDASATLLYDVFADRWDQDTVAELGLDPQRLAPLLPFSGCVAGGLTVEAAQTLGLRAGIPVAAGAADTAAAALGSGLTRRGDLQLTIGTGAQLVTPQMTAVASPSTGTHLYRAATATGWYSMGAITNAGLALGWVCRTLNAEWAELYAAATAPARVDDPLFLPHLTGERTPYLDSTMRGAWTGLALGHGRTALLRAALEGVAFAIRDALDALPTQGQCRHVRLAGGGSAAVGWRQMLADVLQRPLHALDVSAASGRGAALLGGTAAGLLDQADIEGSLAPATRPVADPEDPATSLYTERRNLFHSAIAGLRGQQPSG